MHRSEAANLSYLSKSFLQLAELVKQVLACELYEDDIVRLHVATVPPICGVNSQNTTCEMPRGKGRELAGCIGDRLVTDVRFI